MSNDKLDTAKAEKENVARSNYEVDKQPKNGFPIAALRGNNMN